MTATSSSPLTRRCSRYSPESSTARDLDSRIGAAKTGEQIGEDVARDERGRAEMKFAGRGDVVDETAARIGDGGEDATGVAEELVALVGQADAASGAVEKLDAEVFLQLLDRLGHRALRNGELSRGAGDRTRFRRRRRSTGAGGA